MPVSREMRKWIDDARKRGASPEVIRKKLTASGYRPGDIDAIFAEMRLAGEGKPQERPAAKASRKNALYAASGLLVLIALVLALSFRTGNGVAVALTPVDSMTEQGCAVDASGWSFYGNCAITKTIDLPKRLQGKPLTMVIEASGTPLYLQEGRMINTYTFKEMGAKEFLEWDWANNPRNITIEVTYYDQRLNQTTSFTFEADHWPEGYTPSLLALYLNGTFRYIGTYNPLFPDYILENVSFHNHSITLTMLRRERYDTVWPVFNASVAGESHIVELTSGEWKSYQIQLLPQTESVTFTAHFLNDMFVPGVRKDSSVDSAVRLQDRNLFIRKVLVREKEE